MIAIKNATLVMKDHLIPEAVLLIEDGQIADCNVFCNIAQARYTYICLLLRQVDKVISLNIRHSDFVRAGNIDCHPDERLFSIGISHFSHQTTLTGILRQGWD